MTDVRTFPPGATIGLLGGGQLGRMFTLAARRLGYRVHVLEPHPDSPAGQVGDVKVKAGYDDLDAARAFAEQVDVITFEFENIPAETLAAISGIRPTHPSPEVLEICRHRVREKTFFKDNALPHAPFVVCHDGEDVEEGLRELGAPAVLKTAEFGYDGKGQVRLDPADDARAAWETLDTGEAVLEAFVDFELELSVIVARTAAGQMRCFPAVRNDHHHHILDVTTAPGNVEPAVAEEARRLAERVTEAIGLVGVLAVEMFLVREPAASRLVINELAPRPHNSGHFTIDSCVTCQFEQQLRAVCGLPLGDPRMREPAAMANLLGDLWFDADGRQRDPDWRAVLAIPDVKLHLYGKVEPRPGRKMGHLNATAESGEAARAKVLAARQLLIEGSAWAATAPPG